VLLKAVSQYHLKIYVGQWEQFLKIPQRDQHILTKCQSIFSFNTQFVLGPVDLFQLPPPLPFNFNFIIILTVSSSTHWTIPQFLVHLSLHFQSCTSAILQLLSIVFKNTVITFKIITHTHTHTHTVMVLVVPVLNGAPHQKDIWGSEGTAPHILRLGTGWM
jgi:hypothetical protein